MALVILKEAFGTPSSKQSTHIQKTQRQLTEKSTWLGGIQKEYSYIQVPLEENKYWFLFWYDIKKQMGFLTQSASSWPFGIKL